MGYMRHHAIIVTGWRSVDVETARAKADDLGMRPSEVGPEVTNGYISFFIPPDGSKEGWNESEEGDERRQLFVEWLREVRDRESVYLDWVEVQYRDDDGETIVTDHSDAARLESGGEG